MAESPRIWTRLPPALMAEIKAHAADLAAMTRAPVDHNDAVIALLRRGLDTLPPRPDDRSGTSRQPEDVAG